MFDFLYIIASRKNLISSSTLKGVFNESVPRPIQSESQHLNLYFFKCPNCQQPKTRELETSGKNAYCLYGKNKRIFFI